MTSPSFSRPSSSATMTGRPARSAVEGLGDAGESSLPTAGKGDGAQREHPLDVAGEDVGLDVDAVADRAGAEGRRGEGLGDERDLEPLVGSAAG